MNDFKSYSFIKRKGIDDLHNIWAWTGNSQGDESCTNDIKEGLASDGWMSFRFNGIDPTDQDAIDAESARRIKHNKDYIKDLKANGEYLKEYQLTIHVAPNSIFDGNVNPEISYRNFSIFIP